MEPQFDSPHALAFFRSAYLNVPGCIWVGGFEPEKFGRFFATTEEGLVAAVEYAARMDATLQPKGIYFRCTTVKEPLAKGRGLSSDTYHVPNYWSDLDIGEEGHRRKEGQLPNPPDQESAYALISEAGLPEPTILIHSGGGLYGLWVPSWPNEPGDAAGVSERIQAWLEHASNQHGWHYGTGVSDLARVLRLPGSINRKNPANPRPCRVIGGSGVKIHVSCWPTEAPEKPRTTATALPPRRTTPYVSSGSSVFDALNGAAWADVLEPADWEYVKTERTGAELWTRPGGSDSEYSARCFEHNMVVFSTSTELPEGAGQRLTKARVFAYLHHGGDLSEAAKDLIKAAHGNGGTVAANSLPADVLDAIKTATDWVPENWVKPTVIEFIAGSNGKPVDTAKPAPVNPALATPEEVQSFLDTFTVYRDPRALGRRLHWMRNDSPSQLPRHAVAVVHEAISGLYPADRALDALGIALRHHGHTNPAAPHTMLANALGVVLTESAA